MSCFAAASKESRLSPVKVVSHYLEETESVLFFHGTSQESADSIEKLGMNTLAKTRGSDEMMGHPADRIYNYVTTILSVAAS